MSTSGKFGERQSWRRASSGEAGKRRVTKAVLTAIATILALLFLYIILSPKADRRLRTILVSIPYDIEVVTPPMFADNARKAIAEQLQAEVVPRGDRDQIRRSFQSTDLVSKYLDDDDDTVMVIVRGYLMLDSEGRPSLACSDLRIGETADQPQGLLPISEILQPLAAAIPSSFDGLRLVVFDIEPLAAHPALDQWSDQVFLQLDQTLKQIDEPQADRLVVLVTRGPMQNAGWDHVTKMPLSTQTLLDGLAGKADLNGDYQIKLQELCAFVWDRYDHFTHDQEMETPRLLVLQGKRGLVDSDLFEQGELDFWVNRFIPPEEPEETEPEQDDQAEPGEGEASADDAVASSGGHGLEATNVVWQGTPKSGQADNSNPSSANSDASTQAASNGTPRPSEGQPGQSAPGQDSTSENPAPRADSSNSTDNAKPVANSFWDLRDQFESVQSTPSGSGVFVSAPSLAPHLWRQLVINVLGAEIKNFDPTSPSSVPDQVANDLEALQRLIDGDSVAPGEINDAIVLKLRRIVEEFVQQRAGQPPADKRLRSADSLQHAIAVARSRLWAWLEFQRQAAVCGAQVPDQRLILATREAEITLARGSGTDYPDQAKLDRQLDELKSAINVFDRNIKRASEILLGSMESNNAARNWELTRAAWAWLRSPLPTGNQRRKLEQAIKNASRDETDTEVREIKFQDVQFASDRITQRAQQLAASYGESVKLLEQPPAGPRETTDIAAWRDLLNRNDGNKAPFAKRFEASLRIDPRIQLSSTNQKPMVHLIEAKPRVRRPNVAIVDADGQSMDDSAVIRLETMQDTKRIVLRISPDRDRQTNLLVSFDIKRSSNQFGSPPVDVRWKVPGLGEGRPGEPISIRIAAEQHRDLPLEISPEDLATSGDELKLELQIRGDRQSDEIEGIVGTRSISIDLPRANRIRLVAGSYRGIGCSKEVLSDEGGLPGGLWLRTFNDRSTPFQLKVFNESGKACMAQVWLIQLPNPMPEFTAYWPEFAANRYSNPEGGLLGAEGRILGRFLRPDRIIKGPATMSIPADQQRVNLDFSPPPPPEGTAPPPPADPSQPSAEFDVSDGLALVCRLVDAEGNEMPEPDQVIPLVAKPWAADDYVIAKVGYSDGEVEVDCSLNRKIDGDSIPDEIPEIEKRPVVVTWTQDDQWADFIPETTSMPESRTMRLRQQAGETVGYIRVPVGRRRRESWIRLDVDGWPRAIKQYVCHQTGSIGQEGSSDEVGFASVSLTRPAVGTQEAPPPTTFYAPENDVYFKGGGEQLIATIRADLAVGSLNQASQPEVIVEVEGRRFARFRTDRTIKTIAKSVSDDGVVTLLSTVSDLQLRLNQGQRNDDQIPIIAKLNADDIEQDAASINVVLDSKPPGTLTIRPRRFGPYYSPGTLDFSISANDPGKDASGIARIDFGLDTKNDGKADTQRSFQQFDPPVSSASVPIRQTVFKFQVAATYGIVVTATDAAGNQSDRRYAIEFQTKPKPKPKPSPSGSKDNKPPPPKMGRLHGVINTRAGMSGTLTLKPAPDPVTSKEKDIFGQDRRFDFGPLPEGTYTLTFKGAVSNKSRTLTWKELEVDTTAGKTKPLSLDLDDAESD